MEYNDYLSVLEALSAQYKSPRDQLYFCPGVIFEYSTDFNVILKICDILGINKTKRYKYLRRIFKGKIKFTNKESLYEYLKDSTIYIYNIDLPQVIEVSDNYNITFILCEGSPLPKTYEWVNHSIYSI